VVSLLKDVGAACAEYQDKHLRNLTSKRVQCDEIWSFCYAKQKNVPEDLRGTFGYGDVWTWVALDADTKLVPCWHVGWRNASDAHVFMTSLADRLINRVQLTTDGNSVYLDAVWDAFEGDVDYAQLVKIYGQDPSGEKRYSPAKVLGTTRNGVNGKPVSKDISTSHVERQNLTMRMSMRRFTRLTNAFSKKVDNHISALALYFMHYNFVRTHQTLANPYPRTPAMVAGVTDHIWTVEEIVKLIGV